MVSISACLLVLRSTALPALLLRLKRPFMLGQVTAEAMNAGTRCFVVSGCDRLAPVSPKAWRHPQ